MRTLTFLLPALLSSLPLLQAQGKGQGSSAKREQAFEIVQNFPVSRPLFPFVPENLGALRDPGSPGTKMLAQLAKAIQRFESIHQRSPKDDLELAWAITDWVSSTHLHPTFYPSPEAKEKLYPPHPDAFLSKDPPAPAILEHILKANPRERKTWPSPLCHHQNAVAGALLNLAGLYTQRVSIQGHTGLQYFSWTYGKWIWCEATFNEHYVVIPKNGAPVPLSVLDLHTLTLANQLDTVRVVKHGYPNTTYLNLLPEGFRRFVLYNVDWQFAPSAAPTQVPTSVMVSPDGPLLSERDRWVPSAGVETFSPFFLNAPLLQDPQGAPQKLDAIGLFGPIERVDGGIRFSLRTLLPYTASFELAHGAGSTWVPFEAMPRPDYVPAETRPITLTWDSGLVRIRAVDTFGNHSQEFIIRMTP